jgi:predicted nucleic acid-binding protein
VINAFKAGALDVVLSLDGYVFILGAAVTTEAIQLREEVQKHLDAGRFACADESSISATTVASVSGSYNLGIGESECIVICQADPESVLWSDDGRARAVASMLLGANRVVGTGDLLRTCADRSVLTPLDAYTAHELARSRGAFLPHLAREFFQS